MQNESPVRILLIEDDPGDSDYLVEILSDEGHCPYEVICARDLDAALKLIRQPGWDIILSDLTLPDSRGLDTFAKVQENAAGVPILVLTGLDDESAALEAVRRGAQDYLVKGQVKKELLVKAIRYGIERNKMAQELKVANQRLERLAHNDPLTDLLNRRGLQQVLNHELARAHREGTSVAVIVVDLDDFKKINDHHGHSSGDAVLKEIANRLRRPLRSTDFAARIGGDEFLVLLPDTEPAEGVQIAEKVRTSICDSPFAIEDGRTIQATASVGVIAVSDQAATIDDLLSASHDVLYRSKQTGKNRVSFDANAAPPVAPAAETFRQESRFHAVVQPIQRLSDGGVAGYELLTRASVPHLENPMDFFRLSTDEHFNVAVDRHCWQACLAAATDLPAGVLRHINLRPPTLKEGRIEEVIDAFAGAGGAYCVEVSQHLIVGDPSKLAPVIETLRERGIKVAIDDASLSSATLETMVLLEPDFLKIEPHFVRRIHADPAHQRLLEKLLKLAGSLDVAVIAEGIELEADLTALKRMGVPYGQGFFWGRPAPVRPEREVGATSL